MKNITLTVSLLIICCFGCKEKSQEKVGRTHSTVSKIKYAEGFRVKHFEDFKEVEIVYPYQGATSGFKYLLVRKGKTIPPHDASTQVIEIPLTNIVCTSTTHIPLLDYLDESDKLVGFPTTDFISSEKMRARVDSGKVVELGIDKGLDLERLAVLHPDMVMAYTMKSDYGQFRKIESLGVPVVINAEYLEKHPLGRAEWIKFMALFFDKEVQADSVFNNIEKNYREAKAKCENVTEKPTVLSGIVYGDAWFLPGGQNYASKILKDAGCAYLWEADSSNGFLQLSFESVYAKAERADLWIGVGDYKTLQDLKNADERYTKFNPFSTKQVYNYDARKGAKGGSEFMELGYLRPDIILKDLIKIAHPALLPDHQLFFYRKLE